MTSDHFSRASQLFGAAGHINPKMKAKLTFFLIPMLAGVLQLAPHLFAQPPDRPFRPFQNERRARWASRPSKSDGRPCCASGA